MNQQQPAMVIDLATAVLLIEVSRADFEQDDSELATIRELLLAHLSLPAAEVDELLLLILDSTTYNGICNKLNYDNVSF